MFKHCRFCAQKCEELFHLINDSENHCVEMITFLQIDYIDLSDCKLPKYTCRECLKSFINAYNFLKKVKQSQLFLNSIYNGISMKQETVDSDCEETIQDVHDTEFIKVDNNYIESNENVMEAINYSVIKYDKLAEPKIDATSESESSTISVYNGVPLFGEDLGTKQKKRPVETEPPKIEILEPFLTYNGIPIFDKDFVENVNLSDSWNDYKWCCCHCNNDFDNMDELRFHSKEHHNTCYGFNCNECEDEFNTFNAFIEHVRQHRGGLRYYCQYCNKGFISESECLNHTTGHWEGTKMICDNCGEILPDQNSLERHKSLYKKRKLQRSTYRKVAKQVESVDQPHWKTWNSYDWTCQECNLNVPNIGMLRKHVQEVHKKCFAMKCVDCLKVMTNFRLFTAHVSKHRPYLKKFCQYCNIKIEDDNLDQHIENHYSGTQKPCDGCGQMFENNQVLMQHMIEYDSPRRKGTLTKEDLTCDKCNKSFSTMAYLRAHRKNHDSNRVRYYTCYICGKAFYTAVALSNHKTLHSKKSMTCDICKMTFHTKHTLRYHIMTHSNLKPFKCDQCNKYFRTKRRLECHGLSHTDIKKFVCVVCEKKFKYNCNLKNHMNQHTGLRPFACQMCEKTFTNLSNCNKHMLRIHGAKGKKNSIVPASGT